jgi:flagellar protein FliO/FliZ
MSFMSVFGENRTLAFVLAAVCLLIGVALVFVLFRIVFGRGIKLPGGRSRQQRLGIVDAFEIDRQRQLVIVRRDNVEHLLMIGGPNDVVIESTIIRAEAREGRNAREREPAVSGLSWPAGTAATEAPAQPALEPAAAARAAVPEPPPPPVSVAPPTRPHPPAPAVRPAPSEGPAAPEPAAPEGTAVPAAPPPRPIRPPPPPLRPLAAGERPTLPPRPAPLRREPRPLPPFLANRAKPAEGGPSAAPISSPPAAEAPSSAAPPEPVPESTAPAPSAAPAPPPAAEGAAPQPATEGEPAEKPKIELDPLESLEEEMAKLLGRSPNP